MEHQAARTVHSSWWGSTLAEGTQPGRQLSLVKTQKMPRTRATWRRKPASAFPSLKPRVRGPTVERDFRGVGQVVGIGGRFSCQPCGEHTFCTAPWALSTHGVPISIGNTWHPVLRKQGNTTLQTNECSRLGGPAHPPPQLHTPPALILHPLRFPAQTLIVVSQNVPLTSVDGDPGTLIL